MVSQTQNEIKILLTHQLMSQTAKSITALLVGIASTSLIPLTYSSIEKGLDKIVNLFGLIGGLSCFTYAYCSADKLREYQGKLAMFKELEKERFIKEQLILQSSYLSSIPYQLSVPCDESQDITPIDVEASQPSHPVTSHESQTPLLTCPHCESVDIKNNGSAHGKPRFKCGNCHKTFGV